MFYWHIYCIIAARGRAGDGIYKWPVWLAAEVKVGGWVLAEEEKFHTALIIRRLK